MGEPGFDLGLGGRNNAGPTRALKELVRRHLNLGAEESVFVAEVTCGEADCPDVETVIAIFIDGARRQFKLKKAIKEIAEDDLEALFHSTG